MCLQLKGENGFTLNLDKKGWESMKGFTWHLPHTRNQSMSLGVRDVAMLAMLEIARNTELKRLGWRLLLQVIRFVIGGNP